jgi:hypothetical protein
MQLGMEIALVALDAKARFRASVPRHALIDLVDTVKAVRSSAARHAFQVGLEGGSATQLTGYEAHKVFERKLRRIAAISGGDSQDGGLFPGTELRNFQVLARFGSVLLARASIFEVRALPSACTTRKNGSSLNSPFSHQEELFSLERGDDPTMFALLLTCRDKEVRGRYHEVAIGLVEPDYSGFIFYEVADSFIAGYGTSGASGETSKDEMTARGAPQLDIKLRNVKTPFEGGERPPDQSEEEEGSTPP